ncbi:MAG: alpha/beta hydrolase [Hyphomonadaceae bacterium]
MRRRTLLAGLAALAGACAPTLGNFNRLAPQDRAARRIAQGLAYGNGPRRALDIYAPEGAGPWPVLAFFYGGSWSWGAKEDYEFVGRAFAAQGFLTVVPDYRVAPDVFPSFLEDCAAAVAWTHANVASYGGDANHIVLAGHSAGAYNAIMLALDRRYLDAADVPAAAIKGAAGLSGPYDFLPLDVDATRNAFGHVDDLDQTQPVRFARADAPPLWLGWGEKDDLVGRRSIEGLAGAMRAAGGEVEAKIYPNLGHAGTLLALSRPLRGRAPVLADVIAFARRATGAAYVRAM